MEVQTAWQGLLPLYLFLGGLGGSTLALAAWLDVLAPKRYRRTVRPCAWSALLFLILGVIILLADTGTPFRALLLWNSFSNPTSWLTIGAWTLAAALCGNLALSLVASCCAPRRSILRSILGVACIIVGAATCIYTGVLLMTSSAIVSWNTVLVPALFVLSSLNSGTAFVSCIYRLKEKAKRARRMTAWNGFTVFLTTAESVVTGLYLSWLATSSPATLPAAQLLIDGVLSLPFWLFVVGAGLVVPWAIALIGLLRHKDPKWLVILSAICTLIGACALRFLILAIGLRFPVGLI
ncbi:NrfD/PsrC family molybdoenzyme membrane anchor subunit [Adlercreutzia equolifaciens]|uniref:NrfD/PsrC family molybdoenzyme membrane anchor subunit n=1 Tax=Adlercreutzia equolifaciens TaxID=446660 RepID=UPI0026DCF3DF|nr:NrfD/PsrC family molybdoenzyme membrane anchor subunit [Adlercreutzia equolifaciens]